MYSAVHYFSCIPSLYALLTAYETETSSLKNKLKEVNSQLQEHEELYQAKSVKLEKMEASLREKTASISGMDMKYISNSTIQCIIYGKSTCTCWSNKALFALLVS